jgi:6,7-dimethyl-8-ribityllumazine synthase
VSQRESWPGEEPEDEAEEAEADAADEAAEQESEDEAEPQLRVAEQAAQLDVPDDIDVLEGEPRGSRRGVGIVVARSHLDVANRLLESALAELEGAGVGRETITVMAVPGPFELALAAMALAKTRRYACIVALGCAVRGETANFELVTAEAASGLQLAALETGVPVSFGLLALDDIDQAPARIDRAAEAARTALEMADLFQQLRATAQASK